VTARDVAAKVEPGQDVPWALLETEAFADHPGVAWYLKPDGYRVHFGLWRTMVAYTRGVWFLVAMILIALGYYFPNVVAFAIVVNGRFGMSDFDPHFSIPVAGALFGYSALAMAAESAVRLAKEPKDDKGLRQTLAVADVVFGIIGVITISTVGPDNDVAAWPVWAVVTAISTGVAVAYFVAMTVVRRRVTARRKTEGPTVEPLPSKPNNVIKRALRRLTEQQRSAARSDIDAAITDLADRGVVADQEASVAREAGLAALAKRMLAWQEQQNGLAAGSAPRMGSGTH